MSSFRFAEPQWAYALWGLLALTVTLFWLEQRGGSALDRFVGVALQSRLVRRPGSGQRGGRLALLLLAALFAILALMRPQWGMHRVAAPQVGAELMICLDVSRSMQAEDVVPNRLERAKAEIADLLPYLDGNQVGLLAFAGRTSVLSPLTPDFGFLRLALDEAGPHSVTRGGTRLEEPIRKALAGFGPAGNASRAILLITDGEDHGSFPLDAARAAAEQGVQIIAIGFGDEAGSEILVTDPRTGARTRLLDGEGRVVRSRLDGDLLREVALVTQGVYVPAGTGVLDLESIYEEHIARLMRGRLEARSRTVYDELYPWAVLLGLVCLLGSAGVAAGGGRGAILSVPVLGFLLAGGAAPSRADVPPAPDAVSAAVGSNAPGGGERPRALYNQGVTSLRAEDFEGAQHAFAAARRDARDDGELRFRATSNLGWALARRAESLEEGDPEEALRELTQAAAWLREAVSMRPENEALRANLEVVLRRSLLLADRLAKQHEGGIESRLTSLAEKQRSLMAEIAALLEARGAATRPDALDRVRRLFQARATEQRTVLSDADLLAADVARELDALEQRPDDERGQADDVRAVQLANVLHYLHPARERMGQARRQLRRREGERAYRRASLARDEVKRALDQLRDPEAVLGSLLRDVPELLAQTALLADRAASGGVDAGRATRAPWITAKGVVDHNATVSERVRELSGRLEAGLSTGGEAESAAALRANRAMGEALPLLDEAVDHFDAAGERLEPGAFQEALSEQRAGARALADARERFLALRGLIEAAYASQRTLDARLTALAQEGAGQERAALRALQEKNLERAGRLALRLEEERKLLDASPAGDPAASPAGPSPEEQARLAAADPLLERARTEMETVRRSLAAPDPEAVEGDAARAASAAAVGALEDLRRLFFSIMERVQELLATEVDLGDESEDALALVAQAPPPALQSLAGRQEQLARRAEEVAWDLESLSRQQGGGVVAAGTPGDATRQLREAGEHVLLAQEAMDVAATHLASPPIDADDVREPQRTAVLELRAALEKLQPPSPSSPPEETGESDAGGGARDRGSSNAEGLDPAQILQQVRDREAERRRQRQRRVQTGTEPVEKDW